MSYKFKGIFNMIVNTIIRTVTSRLIRDVMRKFGL